MNADGTDLRRVTFGGIGRPFWSPDGESIAYCRFGYDATNHYNPYEQLEAAVVGGRRYLAPDCGTSWQARPQASG